MSKSVSFTRPKAKVPADAETWVSGTGANPTLVPKAVKAPVPMKRLTLDIPEELHRRVKSGCAVRGEKIAEVVRRFLDAEFPVS
jgi:hypothetical protein